MHTSAAEADSAKQLPRDWEESLQLIDNLPARSSDPPRTAVFDLDNTLLIHDVGDAVFTLLRRRSLEGGLPGISCPLPLSGAQYQRMRKSERRREAYCLAVTAMAGLEPATVVAATREVMNWPGKWLEADGVRVPVPRADPLMLRLLDRLRSMKFAIYVISASNHFSVRTTVSEYLGLPPQRAWGILPIAVTGENGSPVLTDKLVDPVPYGHGKPELFHRELGDRPILVGAGDSISDIPILNLTSPKGLVIWAGPPDIPNRLPCPFRHPGNVRLHVRTGA